MSTFEAVFEVVGGHLGGGQHGNGSDAVQRIVHEPELVVALEDQKDPVAFADAGLFRR